MVVAAGRHEQGARIAAHRDGESQRAGVEALSGRQVSDVQVDVADAGTRWHRGGGVLPAELAEQAVEVERECVHLELAVADGPLLARAVAVELDPVPLRIA